MKKLRNLLLVLTAIFSFFLITNVDAISMELIEEHNNANIPTIISSDGSTVTVHDTENYDLYVQWIEITVEKYDLINVKLDEVNAIVKEANNYSSENRPSIDDYETSEEYNQKVEEFNAKIAEYQEKYDKALREYYDLFPNFDNTKWEKLVDDKIYLPEATYTGTRPFIVYLKLDDKQNNIVDYDVKFLKINGRDATTEKVEIDNSKWEQLKEGIKKNEIILTFDNEKYSVNFYSAGITETELGVKDSLSIKITEKATSKVYDITLNYNATGSNSGIVSYEVSENEPEGFEFVHSMVMSGVLEEIIEIFGYEYISFMNWLMENEGKLTLTGNGIMYEIKEYDYSSKGEGYDTSISGDYFTKLSVNINAPITGYMDSVKNDEEVKDESKEENVNTGDLNTITFGSIAIICLVLGSVAYRKIKLN